MSNDELINIYWIDLNRFDTKVNKSPWLEVGQVLSDNGFKVTLLCGYESKKYNPEKYMINIRYFKTLQGGGLFRYSLLFRIGLWLALRARSDDIVIVRPGSLIAGVFIKYIRKCHIHMDIRTIPVELHSLRDRIDMLLFWKIPLRLFRKLPDSYSFITQPLKESVEEEFSIKYEDYVIWHSGVNIRLFQFVYKSNRQNDRNKFILLYQGAITHNRGIDLIIKGLAKMRPYDREKVIFRVVGGGSDVKRLKEIVFELGLGLNVRFEGYIPYEDIPSVINEADCCICPLPDREEWNVSSPIKVFECLACAKPIILTPILAHKEIVMDNDFVIWTDGYEAEDFAKAIIYASNNRQALREKAKKAPQFIKENYDWRVQGQKFAKYLRGKIKC